VARKIKCLNQKVYENQLNNNSLLKWTAVDILDADRDRLLEMQFRLCLGKDWGIIEYPEAFMPAGNWQHNCVRIHKLHQFLPTGIRPDTNIAIQAWTEVLRFIIARLTLQGPRVTRISGYSTSAGNLSTLKPLVRKILSEPATEGYFWSRVGVEASSSKKTNPAIFSILRHYHEIGALPDTFRSHETISGDEPERDRLDEPEDEVDVDIQRQWQPFPMAFVSAAGWRSLRIINRLLKYWSAKPVSPPA
jgi:hypothetical protein